MFSRYRVCVTQLTHCFYHQLVTQLITFPLGIAWAKYMPNVKIFGVPLNPGPFTIKEHVMIVIMGSVGAGSAYAVQLIHSHSMKF